MSNAYEELPGSSSTRLPKWAFEALFGTLLLTVVVCLFVKSSDEPSLYIQPNTIKSHSTNIDGKLHVLKATENGSESQVDFKIEGTSTAQLPFGTLEGLRVFQNETIVHTFLGIPFAVPPLGNLRFKKPIPWSTQWSGVREAKKMAPSCLQLKQKYQPSSEDCLYLNVWTTVDPEKGTTKLKPVFLYIFGGGFKSGSPRDYKTRGRNLAVAADCVVVNMNYRVGALGYMYGGNEEMPANLGQFDQLLVMKWVKKYIHLFGGDSRKVTIVGNSSGAISVSFHVLSPLSQPYFHQAIMLSGVSIGSAYVQDGQKALAHANDLSERVGCGSNKSGHLPMESIECLRRVDGLTLLEASDPQMASNSSNQKSISFQCVYGDDFLPDFPMKLLLEGKHMKGGSLIIGTVTNEGTVIKDTIAPVPETDTPKATNEASMVSFLKSLGGKIATTAEEAKQIYFSNVKEGQPLDAERAYNDALGDLYFNCPSKIFGEILSGSNLVFEYLMTHAPPISNDLKFHPSHADDLVILFGTGLVTKADYIVSKKMQTEIRQFVQTGRTSWSPYFRTKSGFLVNPYHDFNDKGQVTVVDIDYRNQSARSFIQNENLGSKITIVQTPFGELEGLEEDANGTKIYAFLGIPFAVPPVGHLRFQKPQSWTKKWTGVRSAKTMPPGCIQLKFGFASNSNSEDCLYLNVWTPGIHNGSINDKVVTKPVLVYIYGGAYVFGSIANPLFYGKALSAATEALVVTANYRVGALGFLYGGTTDIPGNAALYDQALALQWVKENIRLFGGNPNLITLAGQSAGAMSVSLHILSPFSSPLFRNAIMMSGATLGDPLAMSKEEALLQANAMSQALGCGFNETGGQLSSETINCLRKTDAEKFLVKKVNTISRNPVYDTVNFLPLYGDEFIPDNPLTLLTNGRHKVKSSLIAGTVSWEGVVVAAFEPKVNVSLEYPKKSYINRTRQFLRTLGGAYFRVSDEAVKLYFDDIPESSQSKALEAYLRILGDLYFDCPVKIFSELYSKQNIVFQYLMSHRVYSSDKMASSLTPVHGDDIGIFFGTKLVSKADKVVWQELMHNVKQFVRNGLMFWKPFKQLGSGFTYKPYHEFQSQITNSSKGSEYRSLTCSFWKKHVWTDALDVNDCKT